MKYIKKKQNINSHKINKIRNKFFQIEVYKVFAIYCSIMKEKKQFRS